MSSIHAVRILDAKASGIYNNAFIAAGEVDWDYKNRISRRNRSKKIRNNLKHLEDADYAMWYDDVMDCTHVYFRDKTEAVNFYFSIG